MMVDLFVKRIIDNDKNKIIVELGKLKIYLSNTVFPIVAFNGEWIGLCYYSSSENSLVALEALAKDFGVNKDEKYYCLREKIKNHFSQESNNELSQNQQLVKA